MKKIVVDALGDVCPVPVIKATKALKEADGAVCVEVHVDNEIAVQNLMRLGKSKGAEVGFEKQGEKQYVVKIELQDAGKAGSEESAEAEICYKPEKKGKTVVAIGSAAMGIGNDELGRTLMKGFIYALTQLDKLPEMILFYNGGAQIPIEGSVSVEDLKLMEAQGTEIFTCGTCLNAYGLTDKLAVGSVTNMYSIVEYLNEAEKVIKP